MDEKELVAEERISAEVKEQILAEVKALKSKDSKLKRVFPIVLFGDAESGEKEMYIAYFREPSMKAFSKYITFAKRDETEALRCLAKETFIAGDRDVIDDDSLFMFGLSGQIGAIMTVRTGTLVKP